MMICVAIVLFCHWLAVAFAQSRTPISTLGLSVSCSLNSTSSFVQAGQVLVVLKSNGSETRISATGSLPAAQSACLCPNPNSLGCRDVYDRVGGVSKWSVLDTGFRTIGGWFSLRLRSDNTDAIRPKGADNYVFTPFVSTLETSKIVTFGVSARYLDSTSVRWGFGICSEEKNLLQVRVAVVMHVPCWLSANSSTLVRRDIGDPFVLNDASDRTMFFLIQRTSASVANVTVFDVDNLWSADSKPVPFPLAPIPPTLQIVSIGDDDSNRTMLSATFDTIFGTDDVISIAHAANRSLGYLCFSSSFGPKVLCTTTTTLSTTTAASTSVRTTSARTSATATTDADTTTKASTATNTTRLQSMTTTTQSNSETTTRSNSGTDLIVVDGIKDPDNNDSVDAFAIVLFVVGGVLVLIGLGFVAKMLLK